MNAMKMIRDLQKESAQIAKEINIRTNDIIVIGSYSYMITEISDTHVFGIIISKHGHFINDPHLYDIDLTKKIQVYSVIESGC